MSERGGASEAPVLSIVALDDDADFREHIRDVLEHEGHEVRTAGTPEECYAMCAERLPDVLLLDMKMGRASGEEVLEEVRERWPRLCVVVVTGYPSLETMRQTFKQEVFDYLSKPFSVEELRGVLKSAAERFDLGGRPQDRLRRVIGKRVRVARTERGWTLKELGDAAGLSVSQLSSIERGAHLPSLESLVGIASALEERASEWLAEGGF